MLALLLVLGSFLYLTFIGQAVVSLVRPRLGILWSWFIAPTVGLAILIVLMTRLNVWGIPVRQFGPWLTLGLGVFAAVVFWWRRPVFPWRKLAPFFLIVAGYLAYTGFPLALFGFNWISYGNDDMANYCLAAERFLDYGYYEIPTQTDLEGRNYAQHYWFMHALQQIRPGSELAVAWLASLTGLKAYQVFMPAILMLSMLQIFALGAVAIYKGRHRRVVLIAFFLFATSPLFGLGTLYQLIAQVGGIAILLAAASVLLSSRALTARRALLAGLLTACMAILYPEVAPFVALSIILFAIRLRYTAPQRLLRFSLFVAAVAVLTFLFIASNTYQFVNTLVMQSVGSAGLGAMTEINDQSGGLVLFPWTLVPSFVPMLFGLHPFGVVGVDPVISIKIFIAFGLLGYFVWRIYRNFREGAPAGFLGCVMAALGFYLFYKGQDFGLFKLAMFAQPILTLFLAQGFAALWAWNAERMASRDPFVGRPLVGRRHREDSPDAIGVGDANGVRPTSVELRRGKQADALRGRFQRYLPHAALGAFFTCTIPAHHYYTDASLGTYGGGLTEVVGASRLGLGFVPPTDLKYEAIHSDISNVVTAKMLAQYTRGWDTRFLSRSYMDNIANIAVLKFLRDPDPNLGPQARIIEKLKFLRWMLPKNLITEEGKVPDYAVMTINKNMSAPANDWTETSSRHVDYDGRLFVSVRTELDHFNKYNPGTGWTEQNMWKYKLESQLKDRLVFLHSALSPHYYSSARFKAAFFQREAEPLGGGNRETARSFHGTGRYTLFNVINPSPNLRMVIDFSRTSLGEGRSKLPEGARVIGYDDYRIPFVGHGSARVITGIIAPEQFERQSYFTIDFADEPLPIEKPKTGLMRLYGIKFNLDDRRLVGFTRDISVITDEQYRALERPTRIATFPLDLYRHPGLEYSGIFEDGWMADDAFFKLGASRPGQVLKFKGYVPDTPNFKTRGVDVTISINGKPTEIVNLTSGEFVLSRLIREATDVTSITLHFSSSEYYGGEDDKRPFSAFVRELAIEDLPDLVSFRKLTNEKGEAFGIEGMDDDGWLGRTSTFNAPAFSQFMVLKVDLEMPGWASLTTNTLDVDVNGARAQALTVPRATYQTVTVPLVAGAPNQVKLSAGAAFGLPNDPRERSFLVKNLSFENLSPTDLFARGWHRSGYLFRIQGADDDGWVDRRVGFEFPATSRFKTAIVEVMRYPARADLPLEVAAGAGAPETRTLELEKTDRIRIPLSSVAATPLTLTAPRSFPLSAQDPRERSYRIVNIDFE